jgi:hypothetical protein
MTIRKEQYYFRIIRLQQSLVEYIENEMKPANFEKRISKNMKNFVISFPITKEIDQKRIADFLSKNNIPDSQYGIFVTLTTNKDIDGLGFPTYVTKFHQLIGGNIDVSLLFSEI